MSPEQKAFDIAVTAVLKQGRQSRDVEDDICLYRGEDGKKCVIGHLISDEFYKPEMEEVDALDLARKFQIDPRVNECSGDFLMALQAVHDDCPSRWLKGFGAVAKKFGLSDKCLTPFWQEEGIVRHMPSLRTKG